MVLPLWSSVRAHRQCLSAPLTSPWRLAGLRVAASTHRARWQKAFTILVLSAVACHGRISMQLAVS
jgi:hypothetical protein